MDLEIDISIKVRNPSARYTVAGFASAVLGKRKAPVNSIREFAGYTRAEIRSPRSASSQDLVQGNPFNDTPEIWS
jgi:hypothetical protein